MSAGNCIGFAVKLYLRRRRKGREGYLVWRASRLGTVTGHVLYAERRASGSLRVVHYCPTDQRPMWVPPPWFEGKSKWGDL